MIEVPHICGCSPVASVISAQTASASARRFGSATVARKAATFASFGVVFGSAMPPA
jgi:hypothetical protein